MVPLIVTGFLPQQNGSSIMVAKEITTASGCDFDVDKLFLMLYNFYIGEDGKAHKVIPPNPKEKPTEEWTKEERDNLIIDISRAILTHPDMGWINSRPGNFDTLKVQSRKARILEDPTMRRNFMKDFNVNKGEEIENLIESMSEEDLSDFVKKYEPAINPLELTTFKRFHKQNMTGGALIGIYANNTTMQAKFQETSLRLKEDSKIVINGIPYTSLHDIYSKDGKLISFNCSETSAASVDNVKDPVLADLMQDTNTAKILCLLLRLGMPIKDACAMFNIPSIRKYINTGEPIKKVGSIAYRNLRILDTIFNVGQSNTYKWVESHKTDNIVTSSIIDHIIFYQDNQDIIDYITTTQDSKEDVLAKIKSSVSEEEYEGFIEKLKEYFNQDAIYGAVFGHIQEVAEEVKALTKVSRADSPNGAIAHNIEEAVLQKRAVDLIHNGNMKHLDGLDTVLGNNKVTLNTSKKKMKKIFLKSKVARLQAFHSLGIELPLQLVGKHFVRTNPWMRKQTEKILNGSPTGTVDASLLKSFYNGLVYYILSSSKTFGSSGLNTFEEKREWYLYKFPQAFINLRNNNPELNKNSVIQKLEIKGGKILMQRAGKLTPVQRQTLSSVLTSLLYGSEMEKQLAVDLMLYSFYTTGMNFGPDNFGMFFSTTFYNAFPEFAKTLREMNYVVHESNEDTLLKNFMDQFYAIWGTYCTPHEEIPKGKNGEERLPEETETFSKDKVLNYNTKDGKAWEYITIDYVVQEEVEREIEGNLVKIKIPVKQSKLYKKSDENGENVTYKEVGSVYDPFTGKVRYNANRSAKELSKDVNSEESIKKAEEQKKVNYKLGVKYADPGRLNDRLDNQNILNAVAWAEGNDNIPDAPETDIPAYGDERATPAIPENVEDAINSVDADGDVTIPDDIEQRVYDDMFDDRVYDAVAYIESGAYDADKVKEVEDYFPEEGNEELEKPMCNKPIK